MLLATLMCYMTTSVAIQVLTTLQAYNATEWARMGPLEDDRLNRVVRQYNLMKASRVVEEDDGELLQLEGYENELREDRSWSHHCGVSLKSFEMLVAGVTMSMARAAAAETTRCVERWRLSVGACVALALMYFKKFPTVDLLATHVRIPYILVWRSLKRIVPHLRAIVEHLLPPLSEELDLPQAGRFDTHGTVDAKAHEIDRIGEQSELYRGDKRKHFLNGQLTRDHAGHAIHFVVALGHNNDLALWKMSGVGNWLKKMEYKLLADGGYRGEEQLVVPASADDQLQLGEDGRICRIFTKRQRSERAGVEHHFAYAETWAFVKRNDHRMGRHWTANCLTIIYAVSQLDYIPNVEMMLQRLERHMES